MAVSKKIKQFMEQGSWIRRMFEEGIVLKQQYGEENVFDLSLGNPIMQPPPEFFDELRRIANDPPPGLHRYMPNAGHVDTRAAVAVELTKETALPFTADDILMTVGAGGALNVIMHTILDPGDEVVIFAPYFVEYFFYADNHGATCKVVPADENFLPDLDALADAIGPKTRIVLTSSPNNPTGVVYGREVLAEMGQVIRDREKPSWGRRSSSPATSRIARYSSTALSTLTSSSTTLAASSRRPTPRTSPSPESASASSPSTPNIPTRKSS